MNLLFIKNKKWILTIIYNKLSIRYIYILINSYNSQDDEWWDMERILIISTISKKRISKSWYSCFGNKPSVLV